MINVKDIINGHLNELVDKNTLMSKKRMSICMECPLFLDKFGGICNNKLFMNEDGDVSTTEKDGYKRGCGCRLQAKTRLATAMCPHGKW